MHPTVVDELEVEVRDRIREGRLDPVVDAGRVRQVVFDAVSSYEERTFTSGRAPLKDVDGITRRLLDAVAGFGPLQPYLDDPEIEEIWINEPSKVFVARHGRTELTPTLLSEQQVRDLVERMLQASGRRVDLSTPFVDASLPDGSRLHVVIPDITRRHWAVNIRKFVVAADSLDDLVGLGSLSEHAARFLSAAVAAGLNVLVAGGTQAGKTTMLNCLASAIPANERVVSCEEVFELKIPLRDVAAMQCRQAGLEGTGEIPLRRLVKEALRMRPSRILVGEVRQAESLDLLIALNSGLPGMCTIHANSAREAVTKMCTLPLLAGTNVSSSFVVPTVASSIDLVVQMGLQPSGKRQVVEVVALPGRVEGDVVEVADIFTRTARGSGRGGTGDLVRGSGYPPHPERFAAAGFDLGELLGDAGQSS